MKIEFIEEEQACDPEYRPEIQIKNDEAPYRLNMICQVIDELEIKDHSFVLEIGFKNIEHHAFLFQQANMIAYYGNHLSKEFVQQAASNHALQAEKDHVQFIPARETGELDFGDCFFDCCFSVNTIYFWKDPLAYLKEIYRVLQPGGKLILAFAEEKSGRHLPWTEVDFTFYERNTVKTFFREAGFVNIVVKLMAEDLPAKDGGKMSRPFISIIGRKSM